jgi:hypothetical protein
VTGFIGQEDQGRARGGDRLPGAHGTAAARSEQGCREDDEWGPWKKILFKTSNGSNLIQPKHYLPKL